jgi:hypothetical protein
MNGQRRAGRPLRDGTAVWHGQHAAERDDANLVLRGKAQYLLAGFSGVLSVFNNSRDQLDRSAVCGPMTPPAIADHITPNDCWAFVDAM